MQMFNVIRPILFIWRRGVAFKAPFATRTKMAAEVQLFCFSVDHGSSYWNRQQTSRWQLGFRLSVEATVLDFLVSFERANG